ncbi:hypothetical protein [Candidatus Formimonas warabiya]|nr:hypothetical protein [Candidatus Formimonas warabiya]
MQNKHRLKWFIAAGVIIVFIALTGFYFLKPASVKQASFHINLPANEVRTLMIDISKTTFLDRSVVRKVTLSGQETGAIINQANRPLRLKISTSGFPAPVRITTPHSSFDAASGIIKDPLLPSQGLMLDLETEIPPEQINKAQICTGYIHLTDQEKGKELGAVRVIIYNSYLTNKYGHLISSQRPSCCE